MSARLRLVRHGHAWPASDHDTDPGLSDVGLRQARALRRWLDRDPPRRLSTSPLRRARDTASTLAGGADLACDIDPGYAELPWRSGQAAAARQQELWDCIVRRWTELDADRRRWRDTLIGHALATADDRVVVTHFFVINVLLGVASNDPRVLVARPAHGSTTEFLVDGDRLHLLARGADDATIAPG